MRLDNNKEQAFLEAYDAFADAVFRHCRLRVFNHEIAKEITQESFLRTWRYVVQGVEVKNYKALIFRIANNLIIDTARKKKSLSLENIMEDDSWEPSEDTTDRIIEGVDAKTAAKAIDLLSEPYREAIIMRYIEGLEPREIADILEETANVVSVRIHRGIQQLREATGHTLE